MKKLLLLSLVSFAFVLARGQALQLQHPTNGDVWTAFTTQRIQWQFANVDNIKIEVSTDSARTWSVIQSSYPATAYYYDWTVVNNPSDSCFIRILDVGNPGVQSSNYPNSPFKIPVPTVSLDAVGASVFGKTTLPISWVSSGTQMIRLYVSYDNLLSQELIADNIPASRGIYNWVTKDVVASNCFIIIQSVDNGSITDTTAEPFAILQLQVGTADKYKGGSYDGHSSATNQVKSVRLLSPNSKEALSSNTKFTIRWNSTSINQVDLRYSIDNGATWNTIVNGFSASVSTYNWTVPATPSETCLVKVTDASDSTVYDISDTAFTIKANTLHLSTLEQNELVFRGQVLPISWTSRGLSKIKIEYYNGSAWTTITEAVDAAKETYNWVVPSDTPDSIKLKISDFDNTLSADSLSGILIRNSPSITADKYKGGSYDGHSGATNKGASLILTNPNSSIQVASATTYTITWASFAVANVDIAFSADSGQTWQPIVSGYSNTNSYSWKVPGTASTNCLIRVQNTADPTLMDVSDSTFTILAKSIDLVIDTTALRFIGTALPVEWTQSGIEKISLAFKTSKVGSWQTIKEGLPSGQEIYNWMVPAVPSDSLWISVFDFNDPMVKKEQLFTGVFKTLPAATSAKYRGGSFDGHTFRSTNNTIKIYKPAANETLSSGSIYPISWIPGNVTDSVTLQYSIDSGANWRNIVTTSARNGQYNWTVPAVAGMTGYSGASSRNASDIVFDKCLVRAVSGNSTEELVGITTNAFSIQQPAVVGPTYYWVGGSGLWSDFANHWATSSGGNTFHSRPPSSENNVVFDANSFSSAKQAVTIDTPAACKNLDWKGVTNKPNLIITSPNTLTVHGSLTSVLP